MANEWTLEYDIAYYGLPKEMYVARALAEADDKISAGMATVADVGKAAVKAYEELPAKNLSKEELCSFIYEPLAKSNSVSKPTAAQYLADILQEKMKAEKLTRECLNKSTDSAVGR